MLVEGVSLPFALQGLYVIGYRFASGLGSGRPTTFSYAYLIASLLVAVTATSIALVSSVPLSRGRAHARPDGAPCRRRLVGLVRDRRGRGGRVRTRGRAGREARARLELRRRDRGRARTARRLPRAVDDLLDRALGCLPAALRPRPRALAAAARRRGARRARARRVGRLGVARACRDRGRDGGDDRLVRPRRRFSSPLARRCSRRPRAASALLVRPRPPARAVPGASSASCSASLASRRRLPAAVLGFAALRRRSCAVCCEAAMGSLGLRCGGYLPCISAGPLGPIA